MKGDFKMNKKKIALYSVGSVVMVALCIVATMYSYNVRKQSSAEQQARLEAIATENAEAQAQAEAKRLEEAYKKADEIIANGISKEEALKQTTTPPSTEDNKETNIKDKVTENDDGTKDTDGEFVKPDEPKDKPADKPSVPDDQKNDPTKPPEYKPDENKPTKPEGGDKNDKGETYVPGFGWMPIKENTIVGDRAENAGTGDIIGH